MPGTFSVRGPVPVSGSGPTTWDPAQTGVHISLTNSNLTATAIAGVSADTSRATNGHSSGKYYYEIVITTAVGSAFSGAGLFDATTHQANFYFNSQAYVNGVGIGNYNNLSTGHILAFAVDLDNKSLWVNLDNAVWLGASAGAGNPTANTNPIDISALVGLCYPGVVFDTVGDSLTGNFTSASQSFGPPAGFTAWG